MNRIDTMYEIDERRERHGNRHLQHRLVDVSAVVAVGVDIALRSQEQIHEDYVAAAVVAVAATVQSYQAAAADDYNAHPKQEPIDANTHSHYSADSKPCTPTHWN